MSEPDLFSALPPAPPPLTSDAHYPPPQRPCLVCGQDAWSWNGERYVCLGNPALHADEVQLSTHLHHRYFSTP